MSKPGAREPVAALLTVEETAAVLRCSPATVYRHVGTGVLPALRVGGLIRVPPSALAPAAAGSPSSRLKIAPERIDRTSAACNA